MDVKGGLVTLVTEGKPFVNKTKHLVYQIVNIQESRASKTNAIPFLYGHQHVITESSTSKCQHIIYQRLLHRQIVNTKPEQECRSWWGSLVSSPCNTPLYHVTLHVVLLPELVDVAHGGHGGVLVAGSLTAAPPSRVSCSELVLLWGPSTAHCPHSHNITWFLWNCSPKP